MIIFIHVERTAGSSIHSWFAPGEVPILEGRYFVISAFMPDVMKAAALAPRPSYLAGHFALTDLEECGITPADIRLLFSMTRDPVERAASLYALMRRSPDWLPHIAPFVGDRDMAYFYDFCREREFYFPNDQCRRISGTPSFEAAKEAIRSRYTFVGSSDRTDLAAAALRSRLAGTLPGFRAAPVRINDAVRQEMPAGLADRIAEDNSEDGLLHRFVTDRGGIVFGAGSGGGGMTE
jgi:hypothetical protein